MAVVPTTVSSAELQPTRRGFADTTTNADDSVFFWHLEDDERVKRCIIAPPHMVDGELMIRPSNEIFHLADGSWLFRCTLRTSPVPFLPLPVPSTAVTLQQKSLHTLGK